MAITSGDFNFIQGLVRERSAIVLDAGKEYLAEARLAPLVHSEGLTTIAELLGKLRTDASGELKTKIVEAMTTNETSFFRDNHPFEALRNHVLPEIIRARASEMTINVWCAGCSSGQEPFSVAMVMKEFAAQLQGWKVRILATDLSGEMLRRAKVGKFSQLEINRGLPVRMLIKHFEKKGAEWGIQDGVRGMVEFAEINLAKELPAMPKWDLVFMRNVLIYFDLATKREVLGRVRGVMRPEGWLFLGGAETTLSVDDHFKRVQLDKAWCYRLGK